MRIGVIAEGFADVNVVKAILKKIAGVDGSDVRILRPQEQLDDTDLNELNFSNWQLVFDSCKDEDKLCTFFEDIEGEALLIVHVDTAERGMKGYDVQEPQRTSITDYAAYSEQVRAQVVHKLETLLPSKYHHYVAYAIAVEETDAWLIPLFENSTKDTASHVIAKETLSVLIGKDKKRQREYVDTSRKSLNYKRISKLLMKNLAACRARNKSLDLFCLEVEDKKTS